MELLGETHHFPVEPTVAGSLLRPQAEGPVGTVEGGLGHWETKGQHF